MIESTPTRGAVDALIERALAGLIADGEAAARLASAVLAAVDPDVADAADAASANANADATADADANVEADADTAADATHQCLALSLLALYQFREGTVEAGAAHLTAARERLRGGAASARAEQFIRHVQAQWLRRLDRLPEAAALLQPLHAVADQRAPVDAYLTAASLGSVLSMQGDDDASLDLFHEALALARRSGEDSLIVNALNNLGSTQSDLYNFEDARTMLEECLQRALHIGSRRQIIYAAGNLVQCLCLMGHPQDALAVARENLIARIRPDDLPALHRDEEIAQALLDNGLFDEAEAALGDTPHVDMLSNEQLTARLCLQARILLHRGRAAEALQLCLDRKAVLEQDAGTSTGAIDRVDLLRIGARAAAAAADHALACTLLEQAWSMHERLLGRAAKARRLSVSISHRLRQTEWERDTARRLATGLEALNASLQNQVAENERLQGQLREQAFADPLTGLHNRRYLMQTAVALLSLLRRRGEPLAAVIVDLDHFKQVNDRHGHDAGDRVLRGFADLVRRDTRAEDVVCRYGGEEFVLLFPGADAAQAAAMMAERLACFSALRFDGAEAGGFGCTFSAGVAAWRGGDEGIEPLLARADVALYAAKAGGRARVHCDTDGDGDDA